MDETTTLENAIVWQHVPFGKILCFAAFAIALFVVMYLLYVLCNVYRSKHNVGPFLITEVKLFASRFREKRTSQRTVAMEKTLLVDKKKDLIVLNIQQ